ncbi:class I SAM-dependent methyltransferase [Terrimonas pollutisoli]|uniref:class I SAM-dependent methyltransferase n=1 Tax=Terrimonas pollutisoli TaxID=3034147 RepID=UPI0023EA7E7E|nr:class I SAM-dependent methyltransferase [Terrimonas sp. H1YJ31]
MISELPVLTATTRFSNRAENYVKYRPGYPKEIIPYLEQTIGLARNCRIADIGSGTGLFAEPLLQQGYKVICIEPNEEMRIAGEAKLGHYLNFTSRRHTAEATGLRSRSIDLITVAQAFHWMDITAAAKEFRRILKPGGHVVLAWNSQKTDTEFLRLYADIKECYRIDDTTTSRMEEEKINKLFTPGGFQKTIFPNVQLLNFDALKGQLLSSSYIPLPGHSSYETMISALIQLFIACNENGFVRMEFETTLFSGTLH